jgi:hypothetical protein
MAVIAKERGKSMKTTLSRRIPGRRGAETKKMASHVIKLGRAQYEYLQ